MVIWLLDTLVVINMMTDLSVQDYILCCSEGCSDTLCALTTGDTHNVIETMYIHHAQLHDYMYVYMYVTIVCDVMSMCNIYICTCTCMYVHV